MAKQQKLAADVREKTPTQVRAAGFIPGVLYGHGISNLSVQVDSKKFTKMFSEAGYTTLLNLSVGDTEHNVLVREVQFHPLKDLITHVDFYQVRLDEKVRAEVPLRFVGESAAVKDLSGVLLKSLDALDIEALPQDLPHDIAVDISALKDFESIIHISDVVLPAGVTSFHEADEVVALVQPPRSEQELESLSEEAKEDVEAVETIKKEKLEEEEAAEGETAAPAIPEEKS
ncbi:MAG: 50S ribosomal protein L25 [Candidatus Andersenbacteria bacterium]